MRIRGALFRKRGVLCNGGRGRMTQTSRCLRGALRLVACAALTAAAAWAQSSAGGTIETVAGTGTPGYSGDGGPATEAQLNYPEDVAVDGLGNIYIADTNNNRIRKVDASTGNISTFAGGGDPYRLGAVGVAVDASGNVYIADNNNRLVHKVDVSTGNISIFAGGGRLFGSRAEGAAARAVQIQPRGLAVDRLGNVYITESGYDRVYKVNAAGIVSTVAGTGESGYGGDGGAATSAQLLPNDVAVDGAGNLYIADAVNHRIRKVDACTGNISTIAGTGTEGYGGDGGPATSAHLGVPRSVALDSSGNLYIADTQNQRIRRWMRRAISPPWRETGSGTTAETADRRLKRNSPNPTAWLWTLQATSISPTTATTASAR